MVEVDYLVSTLMLFTCCSAYSIQFACFCVYPGDRAEVLHCVVSQINVSIVQIFVYRQLEKHDFFHKHLISLSKINNLAVYPQKKPTNVKYNWKVRIYLLSDIDWLNKMSVALIEVED